MGTYWPELGGTRICDSDRVDQSGSDDANVTDWVKTDDFILAVNIHSGGKNADAAQHNLRWRDVTDDTVFADVAATGEIHYNADTVLVNGTAIAVGTRRCDSQGGDTWQAGEEVEGASLSDSIDLGDEYETEIHFALDCSGADDSHEYAFELYNATEGASKGTCGSTLTIAAAAVTKEFTADGYLVDRLTKEFSIDSILKSTEIKEFNVDSFLKAISIKEFSIDSILVTVLTKEYTINTLLKATQTKEYTIDAVLEAPKSKEFTIDGYLVDRFTKDFSIDTILKATQTKEFSIDANLVAWLSGWSYRKEVTITGQSGAGTNYQIDLDIGDSTGGDFHLEDNCTNFPQDIIVTDNDGTTLLDYWIEDISADPLKIWVEVADDLGSNRTIYIYYGKSGATTNSNGADTFLQYHGSASDTFKDTNTLGASNVIYEGSCKGGPSTIYIQMGQCEGSIPASPDDDVFLYIHDSLGKYGSIRNGTTTSNTGWQLPKPTVNVYHRYKIINTSSSSTFYVDNVQFGATLTTGFPNENIGLFGYNVLDGFYQEWSFLRKYNSPEPAFSSVGSEQTPGAAPETKDFSIDSILQATETTEFSTDSYLVDRLTKEFTVDGYLVNILKKEFSIDANLSRTVTKEFSVDSYLIDRLDRDFSIDLILKATNIKEFTIDCILVGDAETKTFSVDAILEAANTKEFSIDVYLIDQHDKTLSIDTYLINRSDKSFSINGHLVDRSDKIFNIDSYLVNRSGKDFSIDGYLFDRLGKDFTIDAILQSISIETKIFSADSILKNVDTKEFSIDTYLKGTQTKGFAIDCITETPGTPKREIISLISDIDTSISLTSDIDISISLTSDIIQTIRLESEINLE